MPGPDISSYTEEEYRQSLTSYTWTREETDYLFDLCRSYNLRFPIIADRYNPKYNRTIVV